MTAWSARSYRRPFLQVDAVTVAPHGDVVLHTDGESFALTASGAHEAMARLVAVVEAMRDPDSPVWPLLRVDNPWQDLVAGLDRYGLLRDADDGLVDVRSAEERVLRDLAHHAADRLANATADLGEAARHAVQERVRSTAEFAGALIEEITHEHGCGRDRARPMTRAPRPAADFPAHVIDRMMRHWRHTAPLSLAATVLALGGDAAAAAGELLTTLAAGPYAPDDVATHLRCLTSLLVEPAATRVLDDRVGARSSPCSGTNFVLDAETLAVRALGWLGPSRFHAALVAGDVSRRLAAGTYVEQYHVTRRFVEVILPLMAARLRAPLREAAFTYYAEEVGHEAFELQTCVALGLDRDAVVGSLPLPLWNAYIEVFADVARTNPIGLLISVLVTEGLPGTRTPVNDLFAAAGVFDGTDAAEVMRRHEDVNVELDHTTLARRFLTEVPSVSPAVQQRALDDMLLLLELNFRAWEELYACYTRPGR